MNKRPPNKKCVMIIAGEASGDLHGAHLVRAMKEMDPDLYFCGIGGPKLRAQGVDALVNSEALAVMGVTEVISSIAVILKSLKTIKTAITTLEPDLLILIDYPGFNLHLAGFAKKKTIPVLYYISPKVWAWRQGRVKKIEKYVDHLALIFPFEVDFYKKFQVKTSFVGNPLLDYTPEVVDKPMVPANDVIHVGLLPGSRESEVASLFPVMLDAAAEMERRLKRPVKFLISVAPSMGKGRLKKRYELHGSQVDAEFVTGNVKQVFDRVRLVIAASGTVTLEAAIACIPMVIVYKMSAISYFLGRTFVRVNHVGLASIIAGEEVAPELLQDDAEPEKIAETACRFLTNEALYRSAREKLRDVRKKLGGPGASFRTAEIALQMINGS